MKLLSVFQWLFSIIGSIAFIGILFWLGSDVMQAPPTNIVLLADHTNKTYISPECLNAKVDYTTSEFEVVTLEKASKELNYEYDSVCTHDSIWPSRNSAWNFIGTKLGFLKPLNWKWNEDGSWKEEVFKR